MQYFKSYVNSYMECSREKETFVCSTLCAMKGRTMCQENLHKLAKETENLNTRSASNFENKVQELSIH